MSKNNIVKVLIFAAVVVAGALLLVFVPDFKSSGLELKKVDVLADIRKNNVSGAATDTVINQIEPKYADTCKSGVVCFEDFSPARNALARFYQALSSKRRVNIAYFGDSFIEGDLLTGSLRYLLQKEYGGNGVGFVPINCVTAGFRTTVITSASGWGEHCLTDEVFDHSKQGLSGYYFIPQANATATFSSRTAEHQTDTCSEAAFYFRTDGNLKFTTTINRQTTEQHSATGSSDIQKIAVTGKIGHIRITINNPGTNTVFFGVTLDKENSGIVVDNYSLRGISGETLKSIPAKTLTDFDKLRHYDLIVLQYGLNVATKTGHDYDYYKKRMTAVIKYLQENLPESDILLVSIGDRAAKINGEMTTMPGVKNLIATQQAIAADCGIAFWNLMDVMALDGGIVEYVNSKPSKANLDYTHINIRGGDVVAKHLFETIEYGKEKYLEKKK